MTPATSPVFRSLSTLASSSSSNKPEPALASRLHSLHAFFQWVLSRLVEPTSMSDIARVVGEIGLTPAHRNTYANALKRCATSDCQDRVATKCFEHAATTGCLSLNSLRCDDPVLRGGEGRRPPQGRVLEGTSRRSTDCGRTARRPDQIPPRDRLFRGQQGRNLDDRAMIRQFQTRHDIAGVEMVVADGRRHAVGRQPHGPR